MEYLTPQFISAGIAIILGVTGIIVALLELLKKKINSISFRNMLNIHIELTSLLSKLLNESKADRAYIYQIHNGIVTTAKIHLMKISMTDEVTEPGISRESDRTQDLPIAFFATFLNDLIHNEEVIIDNVKTHPDKMLREFLLDKGVSSIACKLIKGKDFNNPYGILCLDYTELTALSADVNIKDLLLDASGQITYKLSRF